MMRLTDILNETENRIARKPGQHKGSSKHSDLYTDENPKGTIHGLKFASVKDAEASVNKIKASGKSHAHKIQAAIAMEQRAKAAGKTTAAGVYRSYINSIKKSEDTKSDFLKTISGNKPAEVYRVHAKLKNGKIGITPWFTKAVIDDVKDDIKKAGHKIIKVEKSTKEADLK